MGANLQISGRSACAYVLVISSFECCMIQSLQRKNKEGNAALDQ